ncbi:MAG: phenylacetate--CoA ligase family protein [Planctomycetota bacterium]
MSNSTTQEGDLWRLEPPALQRLQLSRLNRLLETVKEREFYRSRLSDVELPLQSLDALASVPLLTKAEMVTDRAGPPGRLFDLPREQYLRFHQTSGTKGHPMPVLDTAEDWQWWLDCWRHVLRAAEVSTNDIAMMAFSFGPFIGFWTANDALLEEGAMVVPGGGMSSESRLRLIFEQGCTVVCCTPTYALHLIAVADKRSIDLKDSPVTRLIVAGEPGGSIPSIRSRIEEGWGARVVDHSGASEIGAWGFGNLSGSGLHVIETEFIAERLCFGASHPQGRPADEGEPAELVLTGLGRYGGPAIRYRTGDIVKGYSSHDQPCRFLFLDGGVLGRADDMIVVRGVNVFPSSVEAIVREFTPTAEFRMIVEKDGEMDTLQVTIELPEDHCHELAGRFQTRLAMRVDVRPVEPGSLPTFEGKSKRLIDNRAPT